MDKSMRTTIDLDSEILAAAKKLAAARSQSVGKVISELARAGLEARASRAHSTSSGFPVFKVGKRAAPISLEDVKRDEDTV
jgi:hypothetical protein